MKVKLPYTEVKLHFLIDQFLGPVLGSTFIFHVYVTINGERTRGNAYGRQNITIFEDELLNVHVRCLANCEPRINPSYRLVLAADCRICKQLSFTWSLLSSLTLTGNDTFTGVQNPVLNINPHFFTSSHSELYRMQLFGKRTNILYKSFSFARIWSI